MEMMNAYQRMAVYSLPSERNFKLLLLPAMAAHL
jgi:hypothetical protein